MSKEDKPNQVFKDKDEKYSIQWYSRQHYKEIKKGKAITILTSVQGTGKTTAMMEFFSEQTNAVWIKLQTDKLQTDLQEIMKFDPIAEPHIIYSLENMCSTYLEKSMDKESGIVEEVKLYREIGLNPEKIHEWICDNPLCPYLEKQKVEGLSLLSFKGLDVRIMNDAKTHFNLLGKPDCIFLDELDGFLIERKITLHNPDIINDILKAKKQDVARLVENPLINIEHIHDPELLKKYKEKYNQLTANPEKIAKNLKIIKEIKNAMEILEYGYVTDKFQLEGIEMEYVIAPPIVSLFNYAIKTHTKLICGSATLNHNILQRLKIQTIFDYLKNEAILTDEDYVNADYYDQKDIHFYTAPAPISKTQIYNMPVKSHSLSRNRFEILKKSNANLTKQDETLSKKRLQEVEFEILKALKLAQDIYGIEPKQNTLIITHREIAEKIKKIKEHKRNQKTGISLTKFDFMSFFSNEMHGFNAQNQYGLLIIYGDPLSPDIVNYASRTKTVRDKSQMRRGFSLKDDAPEEIRATVIESMLSELIESIHRSRGTVTGGKKIPVITISNFLSQKPEEQEIVIKTLEADGIEINELNILNKNKIDQKSDQKHDEKEQ